MLSQKFYQGKLKHVKLRPLLFPSSVTVHIVLSYQHARNLKILFHIQVTIQKDRINEYIDWLIDWLNLDLEKPGYTVCMQCVGSIIHF